MAVWWEYCLKPFAKSPSVATNNNTRLASGVLWRKNKLEEVVQKSIARIIVVPYGLSRRNTLFTALHSRKVSQWQKKYRRSEMMMLVSLLTIIGRLLSERPYRSWSDLALAQVHGSTVDWQMYLVLVSVQFILLAADLPTPKSPFVRPFLLSVLFVLASTHLYTGKKINKHVFD